ncbi:MAG TPA: helix-turn-helix transcriptional regulator [Aquabacterium sp.]|uniref:PadR family transcriptional regulator n=1 Tax=Aquabacterium sp. TaxID=1872578 RepID=UPI002E37FC9E|nr:helix-turn-helix transcriptional regulator [Aquabacterium sp.]HEX5374318.1 helix-turn-helix transcriptional regulator [Aquabacterium sp.]
MSLAHALMTSLLEKSSSGYELARRFDKSIGYFWHATHQQIYRELARMEQTGWISSEAAPDGGKTRKRIYQVLDAGKQELRRWVCEPSPPMDTRDELMVRLRADAVMGPLGLHGEIERRMHLHRTRLAAYRAIEKKDFPKDKVLTREAQIQHLILQTGIMYEEGWARWCAEALKLFPATDMPPPQESA